jgi:SAM-dependent methyltransferase
MEGETCLICNKEGIFREVINVPDINLVETYSIVECPSCGVKRSMGIPDNVSVLYTGGMYQSSEDRKVIRFLKRCLHRIEIRRLEKTGISILFFDIGCGSGDFSRYLFESGYSVATADAAQARPSDIRDYPEIPYLHIDYNSLVLEEPEMLKGKTVILRHVLEHIKDPRKFLQRLADYGASYFYIIVPNTAGFSRKLFGRYEGLWGLPFHLWHFDRKSLEIFCQTAGLQVVKSGHETIPVFLYSFHRYLVSKNAPKMIQKIFKPDVFRLLLSLPLEVLSLNNVVYIVAKVQRENKVAG